MYGLRPAALRSLCSEDLERPVLTASLRSVAFLDASKRLVKAHFSAGVTLDGRPGRGASRRLSRAAQHWTVFSLQLSRHATSALVHPSSRRTGILAPCWMVRCLDPGFFLGRDFLGSVFGGQNSSAGFFFLPATPRVPPAPPGASRGTESSEPIGET